MKLTKRIFKNQFFQWFAVFLIYAYSVLVHRTSRWTIQGLKEIQPVIQSSRPVIVAMWHGRMFLAPKFPLKPKKHYAVMSLHGDGEYVAKYMQFHGVHPVRGSSKKGALAAFRKALSVLKEGNLLVITPDGPRGPGMQVDGNVIALAKMAGAVIIPYAQSSSRGIFLKSWDRFLIPGLCGRGVCIYGTPIEIDKDATDSQMKKAGLELQKRLNEVTYRSDHCVRSGSVISKDAF